MADRGFNKLIGKTIKEVDAKAINVVSLICEDGTKIELEGEVGTLGLPVLMCNEIKPEPEKKVPDAPVTFLSDEEIVEDMLASMNSTQRASWNIESKELIQGHHWTGRSIRNTYFLWDPQNPHTHGRHPDDRSMEIMIEVWKRLNPGRPYKGYH